jgi:hypothetical protein
MLKDFPDTHAMLHTLPLPVQKMVRAWFRRGVPIGVDRMCEYPQLYTAICADRERTKREQHTS